MELADLVVKVNDDLQKYSHSIFSFEFSESGDFCNYSLYFKNRKPEDEPLDQVSIKTNTFNSDSDVLLFNRQILELLCTRYSKTQLVKLGEEPKPRKVIKV